MSFNNLANSIAASVSPVKAEGARGRAPNPEIAKLVAQGMPYWKARATVRAKTNGVSSQSGEPGPIEQPGIPASAPTHVPVAGAEKTQAAIDEFLIGNPNASTEEVVDHLKHLNPDNLVAAHTQYVLNPKEVERMIAISRETPPDAGVEVEPALADIDAEKQAKFNRLRAFLKMKPADREKYLARSRDALSNDTVRPVGDDDEENGEEPDPYVGHYVKAMKPADDDEEPEFDEPKTD